MSSKTNGSSSRITRRSQIKVLLAVRWTCSWSLDTKGHHFGDIKTLTKNHDGHKFAKVRKARSFSNVGSTQRRNESARCVFCFPYLTHKYRIHLQKKQHLSSFQRHVRVAGEHDVHRLHFIDSKTVELNQLTVLYGICCHLLGRPIDGHPYAAASPSSKHKNDISCNGVTICQASID